MTLFLKKILLFLIICTAIITFVLMKFGGNVDYFYNKFITPKTNSMIIGDSRSMQGIQPSIINNELNLEENKSTIINYSFTIAQAPIGPLYRKSILKKIDKNSKNGIFIISLTPMMLASNNEKDNEKGEFIEENMPPHNMSIVNMNPNYEYFIKNLSYFHFKALFRKKSTMHKDGWLEENNLPENKKTLNNWKKIQEEKFILMSKNYTKSAYRLKSLDTLVNNLKAYGKIYLLRMPISKSFFNLENTFYPNFDKNIDSIALKNKTHYFNFCKIKNTYKTYDGHHLDKYAGKEFTKTLCDSIDSYDVKNIIHQ